MPGSRTPPLLLNAPADSIVFDLVDRGAAARLGGCTYHVVYPEGRSYEHFPVNANEAEARRASRFRAEGHTPGPVDVAALIATGRAASSLEYPSNLDLRRAPSS